MDKKFTDYNSWLTYTRGKLKIVVDTNDKVSHIVTPRGRFIAGDGIAAWLAGHNAEMKRLFMWVRDRRLAVQAWLHNTPHHRFDCDGGGLAVRVNGGAVFTANCGSDGSHPLYVLNSAPPPFFSPVGVSFGHCVLEPLDYDCGGGRPLCELFVTRGASLYRYGNAMAIVCG